MKNIKHLLLVFCIAGITVRAPGAPVTLVCDPELPAPALFGLETLEKSLGEAGAKITKRPSPVMGKGTLLIVGMATTEGPATRLLQKAGVDLPVGAEQLVVKRLLRDGQPALVCCGSDARGLMYALLEAAEEVRVDDGQADPLARIRETREAPRVKERAVSMYTMQRRWFEQRLFDERHWERYFALLASSRINSFVIVFGYENGGFMAPAYPYFFDVEGFPDVKMVGVKWLRLRYRHLTQFEDYETLTMAYDPDNGVWAATIPGDFIVPEWDLMYFVEVMDEHGRGRIFPDLEIEAPYVIVKLKR